MEMGYLEGELMEAKGDVFFSEGLFAKLQSVHSDFQ